MSTVLLLFGIGSFLAVVLLLFAVMRSGQVSELAERTEQGNAHRRSSNHVLQAPSEPGKHPAWLFYVTPDASSDTQSPTDHEHPYRDVT